MLRYYPTSKIKTNQKATLGQFLLNGKDYTGSYYSTYDGNYFSGENPVLGKNERLTIVEEYSNLNYPSFANMSNNAIDEINKKTKLLKNENRQQPTSYYPFASESDYSRGYLTRYFLKRENQNGYVMEISEQEFDSIRNGTAEYDISFYQTTSILWKLTGPLTNKRISQYDTRAGIIDTNKRLVETTNKSFIGLKEFVGEDYAKFARPTNSTGNQADLSVDGYSLGSINSNFTDRPIEIRSSPTRSGPTNY